MEGVGVEDLPGGPAPEVDVEVAQVLGVDTETPGARRLPRVEGGAAGLLRRLPLDPTALAFGLLLVGGIADDDGDGVVALDAVGLAARLRDGARDEAGDLAFLVIRVAEGVGDEHTQRLGGGGAGEVEHFREDAELGDGIGTELHFKRR